MKNKSVQNSLILLLAAVIWGTAFVSQSVGADHLGAFAFNGLRYPLGCLVLIPLILYRKKKGKMQPSSKKGAVLTGGIACGVFLFLASTFQQLGISETSAGKSGFITAFYIILVPIFGLFLKKRTTVFVWISVGLALVGLFFLCIKDSFTISSGDGCLFACAALFACHILVIDHFSPMTDNVLLSCIQFATAAVLSLICMLIFEGAPAISDISAALVPVLYAGIMSCGVAYTLQIIGQRNTNPTVASIILSLESCVSVIAGMILLNEMLSPRELLGCVFMFAAVLITQLPMPSKKEKLLSDK